MTTADQQLVAPADRVSVRVRFARSLSKLYFVRTGVSLAWVITLSTRSSSLGQASTPSAVIAVLLVLYPLADAVATFVDIRTTPIVSQTLFQRINLVISLLAAVAVAVVAEHGFGAILEVFGLWAILSGAIQLIVGLRRHTLISAQWFMVISGAGSTFAGATFVKWSGSPHDGLATLLQYSTGGAAWYLIAAVWLAVSSFRPSIST
jgi:uncharacterized membrane protein HdeD (DUF308 family)